mgnify:CR=1 FL=1
MQTNDPLPRTREERSNMKNIPSGSRGRIVRMVVVDLLAFGLALCIFAYFHHVRQPDTKPVVLPTPSQTAAPTITPPMNMLPVSPIKTSAG